MTTTYCNRSNIEAIIGVAGVIASCDDDESGDLSIEEEAYITAAIENAAVEINTAVCRQYKLTDVTTNTWLKRANAYMAASLLFQRRGNPGPEHIMQECQRIRDYLALVGDGRRQLPEQNPSFDHLPTVSTFRPEMSKVNSPIRVVVSESTGPAPEGDRKRPIAGQPGIY